MLGLEAVGEELLEQAVAVEDAVAGHGQLEGGARVEEAGGQAAQAPVAQGGVGLLLEDVGEVLAEGAHRLARLVDQAEVGQVVEQGSPHEELGGEVVLHPALPVTLLGGVPVVRDGVDDGGGQALPHLHLGGGAGRVAGDRAHLRGHGGDQVLRHSSSPVGLRSGVQDLHGLSAGIREDGGAKLGVEPVRPTAYTARIPKPVVRRLGSGCSTGHDRHPRGPTAGGPFSPYLTSPRRAFCTRECSSSRRSRVQNARLGVGAGARATSARAPAPALGPPDWPAAPS